MKKIGISLLVILLFFIGITSGMIISGGEKDIVGNKGADIGDQPLDVQIEQKSISDSPELFFLIKSIIGIADPDESQLIISRGDDLLGIIPGSSKFAGVSPHIYCVDQFQYGTDNWFRCEQEKAV